MAFGLSGHQGHPQMVGGDVVVAFYDTSMRKFRAEDYFLSHLAQCDGKSGVCPDERIGGRNDITVCMFINKTIFYIEFSINLFFLIKF